VQEPEEGAAGGGTEGSEEPKDTDDTGKPKLKKDEVPKAEGGSTKAGGKRESDLNSADGNKPTSGSSRRGGLREKSA
jgi:hypothetical protein